MKKILTLLAIGIVGFTSCKEELVQVYSISIDPTELPFNSGGGEETVSVTSTADWKLSGGSYWCYASEYSGKGDAEIIFIADPNEDSESNRSATFKFVSGDKKATLTVTQEKKEYSISIEPKELKFGAEGGEQEITVTSSDEWEVKGESDWCDLSLTSGKNGDKVAFSADPYTNTEEARTANYTFVCGDKEVKLTVTQEAKVYSISVEPTELTYIAAGEEKTVTITSSDEWEFSSDKYWITASEQSGENGATVKIKVEENEGPEIRTGIATFRCGDKQADVKITQEAKEFTISIEPTEIEFEAEGGEQEITVKSSDSWRLSADNDWITTSAKTGSNGDIVKIIVDYTASTEIRTGIITFTCGNKTAEFTVTQNPDDSPIIQFKDPYFLEALLNEDATEPIIDKNGDGQISENEAKSITELSLNSRENANAVRNIDELSFFSSLESIEIRGYRTIEECNLSNLTNLKSVICHGGDFSSLNLSGCSALTEIQLYNSVDFARPSINTSLSSLNISGCSSLVSLCTIYSYSSSSYNKRTKYYEKIIADDCVSLKELKCQTKSLSINNCTSLEALSCAGAYSLDLSDCKLLKKLNCSRYIDGVLKSLDLSHNTALTELVCSGNQLTTLDLSNNTALTTLECGWNQLTTLDLNNNTALTTLVCSGNQLTTLDLSNNTALTTLECRGNQLTTLDLSNNTALTELLCYNNQLASIDLSDCVSLTELQCYKNQLTSLDLSNNTALTRLWCYNNQLTELDLSSNTALTVLKCEDNQLTSLDVHLNRALGSFVCSNNPLQKLIIYKYHVIHEEYMSDIESEYGHIIEYVE